jgi:hypothetical protein
LTPKDETDFWWDFPKDENQKDQLFNKLKKLISNKGESYLKKFDDWEDTTSKFTTQSI